ncbi:MAG: DNA-directed RNA polymerase subunit beta' [bacterium]
MDFDAIKLKIASPEDILKWSHGEVIKPETINYRTQRAEKDGLFSERIFGPVKDWECYCGKYRRIRYKGVVCDKCGVEVTRSIVRRERMGHIQLAAPVAHIWFLRSIPSKIGLILDVPLSKIEKVIYYISYIVTSVNEDNRKRTLEEIDKEFTTRKKAIKEKVEIAALRDAAHQVKQQLQDLELGKILTESEFHNLARRFGDVFDAGTGAEAVRKIFEKLDLNKIVEEVKKELALKPEANKEMKLLRRLKLVSSMANHNMRPEWMILTSLPVLPPDLRPMVALDGGRYATSDLNDLYRRVINRNNRLNKLMELGSPEIILTNEKRMLQEAVDALIDNSARFTTQQLSSQHRPLRSLADMLKGKQGRFRQNLLGKRVDYSGRSVIVVGPQLKMDQCALPKKMALEIFKPFVIHKVIEQGMAHNIRSANRLIEQGSPKIWAILEEVISTRKILLNRAPTLHRLGVQAFKPLLIEDLAIRIPPLVCSAFNADFDGDQMAVHLPLTDEAQKEASEVMLSSKNLLKPATGDPVSVPTQDIVLGCYYLTNFKEGALGSGGHYSSQQEAILAFENDRLAVNAPIRVHGIDEDTSLGRILFNEVLPEELEYINEVFNKKNLSKTVGIVINRFGIDVAAIVLDEIKRLGFEHATYSGISWGMLDLVVPKEKPAIVAKAQKEEVLVKAQFNDGLLTNNERRNRVIEIWTRAKGEIEKVISGATLDPHNPVYSVIDSGARGSWSQPVQMMGMKGLVANPKGEAIELPIKASYKEGFSVLEYFISTHGARKGSTDTALKTASAGYLARRLADVCQDIVIREKDCGTKESVEVYKSDGDSMGRKLGDRVFGRTVVEDVKDGNKILVKAGNAVDRETSELINEIEKIDIIRIYSPITCKALYGLCSKCYGYDLGKNKPIEIGEAVGVVAAQSISEPGTQLTMRTFHIGGVAGTDITHGLPRVEEVFETRIPKGKAFLAEEDGVIESIESKRIGNVVRIKSEKETKAKTKTGTKTKEKIYEFSIPRHNDLYFKVGDKVNKGDQLCEGRLDLKELFKLKGNQVVQRYIINEVQQIYSSEGASMDDKHIEVVIRQMFSRVKVKDPGDSKFIIGDVVEKPHFLNANREVKKLGGEPAKAQQLLMGITKVALSTESFLSAASFIETAKVLINAASEGKIDVLRGLKENVIIGRLIPVGTGLKTIEREAKEKKFAETESSSKVKLAVAESSGVVKEDKKSKVDSN